MLIYLLHVLRIKLPSYNTGILRDSDYVEDIIKHLAWYRKISDPFFVLLKNTHFFYQKILLKIHSINIEIFVTAGYCKIALHYLYPFHTIQRLIWDFMYIFQGLELSNFFFIELYASIWVACDNKNQWVKNPKGEVVHGIALFMTIFLLVIPLLILKINLPDLKTSIKAACDEGRWHLIASPFDFPNGIFVCIRYLN